MSRRPPSGPSFQPRLAAQLPGLTEKEITDMVAMVLVDAEVHPARIHAFAVTGMLVTEHNQHLWSAADVREWMAALAEGEARYGPVD